MDLRDGFIDLDTRCTLTITLILMPGNNQRILRSFSNHTEALLIDEAVVAGMISIIIPTVRLEYLEDCLTSIEADRANYPHFEIIIVNDGSSDVDFLSFLNGCPYRVVHTGKNVGFARANNAGFRVARGEYLMTLNADTVVHGGWLKLMVETLCRADAIAAVGPTVLDWRSDLIQSAGSVWNDLSYRKFKPRYSRCRLDRCPQVQHSYPVDGLIGVCVLFRRKRLFEVGLFDETFVNGWEDMDLSLSLLAGGYRLYHAPATIEHKGGFVRKGFSACDYDQLVRRNRARFMEKWEHVVVSDYRVRPRTAVTRFTGFCSESYHALRLGLRDALRTEP